MEHKYSESTLHINLSAIKHNYNSLNKKAKEAECAAVVKANAYGLGVEKVSLTLRDAGCNKFFVATLDEAIELRNILPDKEIFVLNGIREKEEKEFDEKKLIPVLNDKKQIELWNDFASDKKQPCIIHIDTGMNRLGLSLAEAESFRNNKELFKNLDIRYTMSHLANTRQVTHPKNEEQLSDFNKTRTAFGKAPASISNSGAIFIDKEYHLDLVRPGSALYGVNSVVGVDMNLENIASIRAKIIQIREIDKDGAAGYSSTHEVKAGDRIAVIPVGYADGYLRSLSNTAFAFINNEKIPVIGRVSMDMITLDISNINPDKISIGTEVELLGKNIGVDELAKKAGTIGYEILTNLGNRYKRIYI